MCIEYVKLKLLETAMVPAPPAFLFGIPFEGTDHGIGPHFLFMEELAGSLWVWKGLY